MRLFSPRVAVHGVVGSHLEKRMGLLADESFALFKFQQLLLLISQNEGCSDLFCTCCLLAFAGPFLQLQRLTVLLGGVAPAL
jgi:hypothetical protein